MKKSVSTYPHELSAGILELIAALEPRDIAEPAPVQEIPAEPQQEQVAAEREEIGNQLPNERKGSGDGEENRRKIAAIAADSDDPRVIAREQVLAIARAITAANAKLTREQIVTATGLELAIVKNRLRNSGPNSALPAFTYFSRTEQPDGVVLWGLTHNGAALVREAEGNPQQPSGA